MRECANAGENWGNRQDACWVSAQAGMVPIVPIVPQVAPVPQIATERSSKVFWKCVSETGLRKARKERGRPARIKKELRRIKRRAREVLKFNKVIHHAPQYLIQHLIHWVVLNSAFSRVLKPEAYHYPLFYTLSQRVPPLFSLVPNKILISITHYLIRCQRACLPTPASSGCWLV